MCLGLILCEIWFTLGLNVKVLFRVSMMLLFSVIWERGESYASVEVCVYQHATSGDSCPSTNE